MVGHSYMNLFARELLLHQLRLWKVCRGHSLLHSNLNVLRRGIQNLAILRFSLKIGSICIKNFGFGASYMFLMKWP